MVSKTVTFTNFKGEEVIRTFYFNLSEVELAKLEYKGEPVTPESLKKVIDEDNTTEMVDFLLFIFEKSFGRPDETGDYFIKDAELARAFMSSNAFGKLLEEFYNDPEALNKFTSELINLDVSRKPKDQVFVLSDEPACFTLEEVTKILNKHPEYVLECKTPGKYYVKDPVTKKYYG